MPLPTPNSGESRDDWLSRCMGNDTMNEDFPDNEQRYAVCNEIWRENKMKRKQIMPTSFKLSDEKGAFAAVFATLNVVDHDGDVIPNGAIEDGAKVRISAYNHSSWGGALPVGKGTIHEVDNELHVEGEFFQNTTVGRDTYETVKGLDDLTEWSFGFDVLESERATMDGEQVNKLTKLKVFEVSPVLLGAGVGTRTLEVKALTPDMITQIADALRHQIDKQVDEDALKEIRGIFSEKSDRLDAMEPIITSDPFNEDSVSELIGLLDADSNANDTIRDLLGRPKTRIDFDADRHEVQIEGKIAYLSDDEYREAMKAYIESKKVLDDGDRPKAEFAQQIDTVQAAVIDVVERARAVHELRMQDGRDLSDERKAQLRELVDVIEKQARALVDLIDRPDIEAELLRNAYELSLMEGESWD